MIRHNLEMQISATSGIETYVIANRVKSNAHVFQIRFLLHVPTLIQRV